MIIYELTGTYDTPRPVDIPAGFHGTCAACPVPIRPGDLIRNVDLCWRHADCGDHR